VLLNAYIGLGELHSADSLLAAIKPVIIHSGGASNGTIGIMECQAKLYGEKGQWQKALSTWADIERRGQLNTSTRPQELLYNKALCHAHLGQQQQAFSLMRQAYEVGDSLKHSEVGRQMSEFSVRYKTQEKELELSRVKQEKQAQVLWSLLVIAVLLAACGVLAFMVVCSRYRRKVAQKTYELENRRRFIAGMEAERARLARELHDGTCNDLLGLQMVMSNDAERGGEMIRQIRDSVRRISHELMPPNFEHVDIDSVVSHYVRHYPVADCAVNYTSYADRAWQDVPQATAYELYRVVQEGMGNIVKHSKATTIDVDMQLSGGTLTLSISNDGVAATHGDSPGGIGSRTMADRVGSIGGKISQTTSDGQHRLELSVPMELAKKKKGMVI